MNLTQQMLEPDAKELYTTGKIARSRFARTVRAYLQEADNTLTATELDELTQRVMQLVDELRTKKGSE